jgi:hypothetical protein
VFWVSVSNAAKSPQPKRRVFVGGKTPKKAKMKLGQKPPVSPERKNKPWSAFKTSRKFGLY